MSAQWCGKCDTSIQHKLLHYYSNTAVMHSRSLRTLDGTPPKQVNSAKKGVNVCVCVCMEKAEGRRAKAGNREKHLAGSGRSSLLSAMMISVEMAFRWQLFEPWHLN